MTPFNKEEPMQYILQIYSGEAMATFEGLPADEQAAVSGEYFTTDGPFPETKEALGGYYLLEADDLDAAIELAARVPAARMGGAVEVRPVVER
jgi:hypothetical protein